MKPSSTRRRLLLAGSVAGATAAAGWALRPGATGAPHGPYFQQLAQALDSADAAAPRMVIDLERLLANAALVHQQVRATGMHLRLVAKSLPSLPLLDRLMQATGTQRLMVFNLPYLLTLAQERPATDLLLGKPLPVGAARQFYAAFRGDAAALAPRLQWLIDTPARMAEYRQLARALGQRMRVNLEIDVGLRRGGFADAQALATALQLLKEEPLLEFAGLMGYDAHLAKLPGLPGVRASAQEHARQVYAAFKAQALQALGPLDGARLTWNAAGSPTYHLHDGQGAANEVAVGSALVKPADFDLPTLAPLQPAAFIATPVLKAAPFSLPFGVQGISQAARWWDRNQAQGYFIYGGQWLADPASPEGLAQSSLYGTSSNQQVLVGSGAQALQVNDTIFLRPRQSEAVLQQFGDLLVVAGGKATERWSVLPAQP